MYTTYLIDTENVGISWVDNITKLDKTDKIVIFFSHRSEKLLYPQINNMVNSRCKKEFIEIFNTEKNALDFVIATYLGSIINKKGKYRILSKDLGYKVLVDYWKIKFDIEVIYSNRIPIQDEQNLNKLDIDNNLLPRQISNNSNSITILNTILNTLNLTDGEYKWLDITIRRCDNMTDFNTSIQKYYKGMKKGCDIISYIKPIFYSLKNIMKSIV